VPEYGHKPKRWSIRMLWEPRDLWVGVYWTRPRPYALQVYVCLLPCVPILVTHVVAPRERQADER
jgi:hypothetical protein